LLSVFAAGKGDAALSLRAAIFPTKYQREEFPMSRTKMSRGFQPHPSPPTRAPSRRDVDRQITAEYGGRVVLLDEVTLLAAEKENAALIDPSPDRLCCDDCGVDFDDDGLCACENPCAGR
jgi:hypothetical protein